MILTILLWKTYPCIKTFRLWNFNQFWSILQFYIGLLLLLRQLLVHRNLVIWRWHPLLLAAVICDADEPCSVNTAQAPVSSFTISLRSTTRPFYFWKCGCISAFFGWQMSINDSKWIFLFLVPLLWPPFCFDFLQLPSWNCLKLFPFFIHCGFCIRNFHHLRAA